MVVDRTEITIHAYQRMGINVDDQIELAVSSLPPPNSIEKSVIYLPINFSELLEIDQKTLFTVTYNDELCFVIRKWVISYESILDNLGKIPGCVKYVVMSNLVSEGTPL